MCRTRVIWVVGLCVIVAGCATKEWRQANSVCAAKYKNEIPPNYQQITVNKTRAVQVPSGNVNCQTFGSGYMRTTNCTQGTRTEYIPYTAVKTVDLNKGRRDAAIRSCTTSSCYQQYGNAACKIGK